jgi:hypothetical protein
VALVSDPKNQTEMASSSDGLGASPSSSANTRVAETGRTTGARSSGRKWVLPLLVGVGMGVIGTSVMSSRPAPSPQPASPPTAATSVASASQAPPPSAAGKEPEPGIAVAIAPPELPEPGAEKPELKPGSPADGSGANPGTNPTENAAPPANAAAADGPPTAPATPTSAPNGTAPASATASASHGIAPASSPLVQNHPAPVAPAKAPPPSAAAASSGPLARAAVSPALSLDGHKGNPPPSAAAVQPEPAPPTAASPLPIKPEPPKPARINPDPAPEPDSEEAKLAAASTVNRAPDTQIDAMLDDALTAPRKGPAPPPPPRAMPLAPSREDVTRVMTVLIPAIRGCAKGQSGLATVSVVVKNDGRVQSAAVSGAPFEGTASGRCMEGVVRRMRLPAFQQEAFRVQFPFAIQ